MTSLVRSGFPLGLARSLATRPPLFAFNTRTLSHISSCTPHHITPRASLKSSRVFGLAGHGIHAYASDATPPPEKKPPSPPPPTGILSRILPPSLLPPADSTASFRKIVGLARPERKTVGIAVGLVRHGFCSMRPALERS